MAISQKIMNNKRVIPWGNMRTKYLWIPLLILPFVLFAFQNCGQGFSSNQGDQIASSLGSNSQGSTDPNGSSGTSNGTNNSGVTTVGTMGAGTVTTPAIGLRNLWLSVTTSGAPSPRYSQSQVWTGSKMVVYGGYGPLGSNGIYTDGAMYDPEKNAWQSVNTTGSPSARIAQSTAWTGSRMIVWGGYLPNGVVALNSGAAFDPATNTWSAIGSTGAPAARYGHFSAWTGTLMIIYGGILNGGSFTATGGLYNPVTNTWATMSTTGAPTSRYGTNIQWAGTKMVVWGGSHLDANNTVVYDTTGAMYDPVTNSWSPMSTVGAPTARGGYQAIWSGTKLIVWGGASGPSQTTFPTDGALFDPVTNTWQPMNSTNAPGGRVSASAVWDGTRMLIWGGYRQPTTATASRVYLNDGGAYDPVTNTWTALTTADAPTARAFHQATWSPYGMIVFGGLISINGTYAADNGIYQ